LGRQFWLAEGASQKPSNCPEEIRVKTGSEHAARKDLMILKVVRLIWNSKAADSRSIGARVKTSDKIPLHEI
jgi:hypothetical protein